MSEDRELDGTSKALLERLSARAHVPELGVLELPDDWRADQTRSPDQHCSSCHWDGRWDHIVELHGRRASKKGIHASALEESASAGNLCCAVFLALLRKFDVEGDIDRIYPWATIYFRPPWGLIIRSETSRIEGVYFSSREQDCQAPPGVKVYPNGGHQSIDTGSEESLRWARSHIEECCNSHTCHAFRSVEGRLPTRLVYIPKDAETSGVRLIRDHVRLPPGARYAALSHCWGKVIPSCLTTASNIDRYATEGIPWTEIPRTFRDAMLYARRLDLEYIWIDSMCIIQKDSEDWKRESTRMFGYYSNAYITLASTFASDCNGGFFSERHLNASRLHLLDVAYQGQKFPVYAFRWFPEESFFNHYEERDIVEKFGQSFQLLVRAWIYQEVLVSPRLLLFSSKQLIFECYAGRCFQETDKRTVTTRKQKYGKLLSNTTDGTANGAWLDLLAVYGNLQITYAKDKLPAIAAVAKQFLSHRDSPSLAGQEYLCGLRKSHLHEDLSWTARTDYEDKLSPEIWRVGTSYLAPSWSWASVPRETTYSYLSISGPEDKKKSVLTLTEEHLIFAGDRFGRVLGGYITVEGPAVECIWDCRGAWNFMDIFHAHRLTLPVDDDYRWPNGHHIQFWLDYTDIHHRLDDHIRDGQTVKRLTLLQTWVSVDELQIGFLVLYRNRVNGNYRRLGASRAGSHDTACWSIFKGVCKQAERRRLNIE